MNRFLYALAGLLLATNLSACGTKGGLKTPTQVAAEAEKKAQKEKKTQAQKATVAKPVATEDK